MSAVGTVGAAAFAVVWTISSVAVMSKSSSSKEANAPPLAATAGNEYCRWESFNVSCPQDGVLVIRSAFYGRMKFTRCTELDYHIGCYANVLFHLDDICSGRRQCFVPVPNQELHEIQPCPKDMQTYLEVDYECVKVQTGHNCQPTYEIEADGQRGHLSSLIMEETLQGTELCPWIIRVARGQRINITMMDFGVLRNSGADNAICDMYAVLKDEDRDETFCGGKERMRKLYTSTSNELQITLVRQPVERLRRRFLIQYEAVGCADMTTSRNSWMQRNGETMTVGCNQSKQTWHLVCKGKEWVGDISNCSWSSVGEALTETNLIYPYGLLFSVAIGILLGICVGGCLLAVVLSCRRRRLRLETADPEDRDASAAASGATYFGGKESLYFDTRRLHDLTCAGSMLSSLRTDQSSITPSPYAHMWDLRRHRAQLSHFHSVDGSTNNHGGQQTQSTEGAIDRSLETSVIADLVHRIEADDGCCCDGVDGTSTEIVLRHFYDRPNAPIPDRDFRLSHPYTDGPVYNEVASVE